MDETRRNDCPESIFEPSYNDPVVALLIPRQRLALNNSFIRNTNKFQNEGCCSQFDNTCCSIFDRWWNVRYRWQREIVHFLEQPLCHIVILALILLDCLFMIAKFILDYVSLKKPCETNSTHHVDKHGSENISERLELIIEILEYSSLVLLTIFIIEIAIRIFACGRHWWNFREKKLEWFDAIIVIASFVIDIITIRKKDLFADIWMLFIALRLWRFVGLINSIIQTVQVEDEIKKKKIANEYHEVFDTILNILETKTLMISQLDRQVTPEAYDNIIRKCQTIDESCRAILGFCSHPESLEFATEIIDHLHDVNEKLRSLLAKINQDSINSIDQ